MYNFWLFVYRSDVIAVVAQALNISQWQVRYVNSIASSKPCKKVRFFIIGNSTFLINAAISDRCGLRIFLQGRHNSKSREGNSDDLGASFLSLASKLVNASSNGLVDMREQREETGGLRTCPQRIFLR